MTKLKLDHLTIQCVNLDASRRFYVDVMGLCDGFRPPFDGPPGAWLYDDDGRPVVHLYAGRAPDRIHDSALDHAAFVVDDLPAFRSRLEAHGIAFGTSTVPGLAVTQLFFRDPDGVQIELSDASASAQIPRSVRS
ncbi:MAG: glyoxalase [Alphaproteobacteria bacterium]|nr:glyoxalase [Alphaproteobacteria bacterium]